jgi:hypothetical protein
VSCSSKKHSCSLDRKEDYNFAQKRWKDLHNVGKAVQVQDTVKTHLHRMRFPDNEIFSEVVEIDPDFDPLQI